MSTATLTKQKLSIGPGAIATASVTGGPSFALSTTEWLAIQTYVVNALALPITLDAFRTSLGSGAPSDLSDFQQLVNAYAAINGHVSGWQNDTFPASVSLASDIYNYAQKASIYYGAILPLAQKLVDNPNDQEAQKELTAVLGVLSQAASANRDRAAAVAAKIRAFANQTQSDQVTLSGTDGNGGLVKYYNDKYGTASTDVANLTKQLKDEQVILDAANAEYNHDVVVASTTPTYAWVWPFGTIAAAVVAGVYGKRATDALDTARAAQQQINSLSAQLAADAQLMIVINSAERGMYNIGSKLAAALPVIQKIQGVWGAIADDIGSIVQAIKDDIESVPPIIMNLGVQEAIGKWTDVGQEANNYRLNAYITVAPH